MVRLLSPMKRAKTFDVTPPWNKIGMTISVIKVTGIPFDKIDDDAEARESRNRLRNGC